MDEPSKAAERPAPPPERKGAELRTSKRRAFPFRQRVAFGKWAGEPPEEAFVDVTFRDVSASGCSFMLTTRPEANQLLVQLGTVNHRVLVEAEVVHSTLHQDEFGATFLIGCRFLRRLESPA
jgi:hypothetical protein